MALLLSSRWQVEAGQGSKLSISGSASVPAAVLLEPPHRGDATLPAVGVGMHIRNIYGLSLVEQSFMAEGWYWLEWGADVQSILERDQIKPDEIVELANEIELGQFSSHEQSEPPEAVLNKGRYGVMVRFSGKFYVHSVPQQFAPFDPQSLSLMLEVAPERLASGPERIRLEPVQQAQMIVGEDLEISGYDLDSVAWQQDWVVYPKSFQGQARFSRVTAVFVYAKSAWAMFLKWIFPLLIVMTIVIVAPSIEGVLGDVRLAIPPSALLTLVVMQDSYKNNFPAAPYLTYLDKLYVYSYFVCLAIFLLFLVGTNQLSHVTDQDRERVFRRVNRLDTVIQFGAVGGFVLVAMGGWFL
ncbi:MAG: hypothetical protein VKM98_01695 [Cyanobacteriota bacterium]|nr:hypothetical protein [Cyanobacteriota bacterium]